MRRISFWILLIASAVLFFAPISVRESAGLGLDKLVHIVLFASLFYLGVKTYKTKYLLVWLLLAVYAVAVELIQGQYLPLRNFDILDIGADILGLVVGALITRRDESN